MATHEDWLNELIDERFDRYAEEATQLTLDELYVLIGTLKIVGYETSHQRQKRVLIQARNPENRQTRPKATTGEDTVEASDQPWWREGKPAPRVQPKPEPQRVADPAAFLRQRIIGQDAAVERVTARLEMSHAGLQLRPERPNGVFLFAGPTGVGKTEFARRLAEAEYGDGDAIIRLDMSEYDSSVAATKLHGPDPGYVGYNDQDGWLTTRVRRNPRSVVLLDEIEKAHPDVWNAFLQVFDAGRLTDAHGETTHFSQTVIVMTSNLGGPEGTRTVPGFGSGSEDPTVRQLAAIRQVMAPELINRIDEIVFFAPLGLDDLETIAVGELSRLIMRLAAQDWWIEIGPGVARWLAETGYDPAYGARHLQRNLERRLLMRLAGSPSRHVRVELGDDELRLVSG